MIGPNNNGDQRLSSIPSSLADQQTSKLAPYADWTQMGPEDHFAQFYETDEFLLNALDGFCFAGLSVGDGVVIVATTIHRKRLEDLLSARGIDMVMAKAAGQYVALDAAETLSLFMIDGLPDSLRFAEVIGAIIRRAGEGRSHVRIFGEMVALLWEEGNYDGAIKLESLWNDLQKDLTFSLFCGYPINGFRGRQFGAPLTSVCAEHTQIIPAESYASLTDIDDRMNAILHLQQKAQSLEVEIAERLKVERDLRAVKNQLEVQLREHEALLTREMTARSDAEAANRMKDEFLATVSHELRTPLNAIIGWTHMLRSGRLDPATVTRAVETIERNAKSQAQLVEDILDVSRVITGQLRLNSVPVDLAAVINSSIDSVQLAAEAKEINLEVILDPAARHTMGDSERLQQVVWNLLSNAIKFTPPGGRVEIKLERFGENARLHVSDSGLGISPEFLPYMFDRFRQADGTSTRRHGGLGLGLAIVRHLIELHGGTVEAQSAGPDMGSTFTVTLPLAPPADRLQERSRNTASLWAPQVLLNSEAQLVPSIAKVKVLLVDDDPDTLHVLTVVLEEQQAEVQTANTAAEALELMEWYKPDVLISDLAMPDEDGYDLMAKVRAQDAQRGTTTQAVALTSYVRVEDRTRALAAGFNMFVPKPVQPHELITAIANLVETGVGPS